VDLEGGPGAPNLSLRSRSEKEGHRSSCDRRGKEKKRLHVLSRTIIGKTCFHSRPFNRWKEARARTFEFREKRKAPLNRQTRSSPVRVERRPGEKTQLVSRPREGEGE